MIYSHCIEGEQEAIREYIGYHSHADSSDFCTPLLKVRPPSLIRACKQTREEYLPIYFHETCFRVYADVTCTVPFGDRTMYPLDTDRITVDPKTRGWLRSINQIQHNAFFRNLQFRLTHDGGVAVGVNFNLTYNAQKMRYQGEFVLDDGWPPVREVDLSFAAYDRVKIVPNHAWRYVKGSSEQYTQEWIDWSEVDILRNKLHCLSGVDTDELVWKCVDGQELKGWFDETRRICTC
jgi:hypothetical protein